MGLFKSKGKGEKRSGAFFSSRPKSIFGVMSTLVKFMMVAAAMVPALGVHGKGDWTSFNNWIKPFTVQNIPTLVLNFQEIPPELADIEIQLIFTVKLGEIFSEGIVEVHDLVCQGMSLEDITMSSTQNQAKTRIETDLSLDSLDAACTGRLLTKGLKISGFLGSVLPSIPDGDQKFELQRDKGGISLDMTFETTSENFDLHPPNLFNVTQCNFDLPRDMIIFDSTIANIIIPILKGALEGIVCQIVEQLGVLKSGKDGIFTAGLKALNKAIDESMAAVAPDVGAEDAKFEAELSDRGVPAGDILSFDDNELFDFVSVVINDVMGGRGEDDPSGELLVNEFIRTALESFGSTQAGTLEISIDQQFTVADLDIGQTNMSVGKVTISGLDTFSKFEMLANPQKYKHTLEHSIRIETLQATAQMGAVITPYAEILAGSDEKLRLNFDITAGLNGISVGAATLVGVDTNALWDIQVGQVLGEGAPSPVDCILNALRGFAVNDMSMGIASIESPTIRPRDPARIDGGLASLFNGAVDLAMLAFKASLDSSLSTLAKGTIRDLINTEFRDFAGDMFQKRSCPAYAATSRPTNSPIAQGEPTAKPTAWPTRQPTLPPSDRPTWAPTPFPTTFRAKTNDECTWDREAGACTPSNCIYNETGAFSKDDACVVGPSSGGRALLAAKPDYLTFNTPMLDDIRDILKKTLYKTSDGNVGINAILRTITKYMSPGATSPGSVLIPGDLVNVNLDKEKDGIGMYVRVSDLNIDGIDTVGTMDIMQSTRDPYVINNTLSIGSGGRPMRVSIDVELRGDIFTDAKSTEKFTASFSVEDMRLILAMLLKIDTNAAMERTFGEMTQVGCLMTLLPPEVGMRIKTLAFDAAAYGVVFDCDYCKKLRLDVVSAAMRSEAGSKELLLDINSLFNSLGTFVAENDGIGTATDTFVSDVASTCNAPPQEDEVPVESRAEATKRAQAAMVVSIMLFSTLLVIMIVVVVHVLHSRVKTRRMEAGAFKQKYASEAVSVHNPSSLPGFRRDQPSSSVVDAGMLYAQSEGSFWDEVYENPMTPRESAASIAGVRAEKPKAGLMSGRRASDAFEERIHPDLRCPLSSHPRVSKLWRIVVPSLLFINLLLFILANLGIGASVDLYAKVREGGDIKVQNLFIFTLAGSIVDMWTAGVWSLAIIIALASGAWPYIKLIMLGYCWFCPPTVLNTRRRGKLLSILDILGKWSVVDQFIMVMLMVVFRFLFTLPPEGTSIAYMPPPGFMYLEVRINPQFGFYGFFMAALGSLVVNHFIVFQHRNVVSVGWFGIPQASRKDEETAGPPHDKTALGDTDGDDARVRRRSTWFNSGTDDVFGLQRASAKAKAALCEHTFECYSKPYQLQFTRRFKWFIVFSICFTFLLMMLGFALISFGYQFKGLGAMAFKEVKPGSERIELSLFTLLQTLVDQATDEFIQAIGIYFLLAVFASCVIIIPVIQLILTAVIWLVPLTLKSQKWVFYFNDILSAWAGLEVFVAAIVASALNIERFAGFMVGGGCKDIDRLLRDFAVPLGLVDEDEATCFSVTSFFENPGFFILCLAVLCSVFIGQFVHRSCEQAMIDREYRIKGTLYAGGVDDECDDDVARTDGCFRITLWMQRIFLCDGCDAMNHSLPLALGAMRTIDKPPIDSSSSGALPRAIQMSVVSLSSSERSISAATTGKKKKKEKKAPVGAFERGVLTFFYQRTINKKKEYRI